MTNYQRLADGRNWYGYLALDNFDLIADRIRALIGNGQRYTWVAANEAFGLRPEVRTSQVAENVRTSRTELTSGNPRAHLSVDDTYGVWGIDTSAPDQAAAAAGGKLDHTYLEFKDDRLTIELYAPAGHRLCWVIAVEGGA